LDWNVFHTLERPWLDNKVNESCIIPGKYKCTFLKRSNSGRYRNVYYLNNIPGRSGILIHNGNLVAHSKGCIILGSKTGILNGQPAVLGSRTAKNKLAKLINEEDFILRVL